MPQKFPLTQYLANASPLVFGCMMLSRWDDNPIDKADIQQARRIIDTALEQGITLFDHADIYCFGKAESVFGEVLKQRPELLQQIQLQSKCAIRFEDHQGPKRYDFSPEWIESSVDGILTRLGVEQLDLLMLHRPDPLCEPEQVAQAFERLQSSGKVKHFGVSNMQAAQLAFLQHAISTPLVANQVELSLGYLDFIEEGISSGNSGHNPVNYAPGTVEYCRQHGVQLQAWGSLAQGKFSGASLDNASQDQRNTAALVSQLAEEYGVSPEAVVLGWLMRHPARIQPVIGSTNLERIKACAQATQVQMSREHWYALWESARGAELP
ncbi:aldo/keto reductase [Paraferrimonas sedimenticola]|uniref:Aldo/keto reductase n=1 Tax=Paraferrimonas sedimenticola TaxID=375674 RepID=A0AA37VY12_9GAMM|nr:aldo/keto reductase [Paraferrimonas sedimenticola]GLP95485.1 aldo/keto reductase [Paraferrimonas sedimenticola]